MFWTDIEKDWRNSSRNFKTKWPKLTDADITAIAGKRDELIKRLEGYYKTPKATLEKELDDFIKTLKAVKA